MLFEALAVLTHLCASGSHDDDLANQKLLQSNHVCSIAVDIFERCGCDDHDPTSYEEGYWSSTPISHVILSLSGNPAYAAELVRKFGMIQILLQKLAAVRPEQNEAARLSISILLKFFNSKDLVKEIKDSTAVKTLQVNPRLVLWKW